MAQKTLVADPILETAAALMTVEDIIELSAAYRAASEAWEEQEEAWQAAIDADNRLDEVRTAVLRRILDRVPTSIVDLARAVR